MLSWKKRTAAWLAVVAVLLTLILSCAFLAQNCHHACTGADCPVCAMLLRAAQQMDTCAAALPAALILTRFYFALLEVKRPLLSLFRPTLVTLKVKLTN